MATHPSVPFIRFLLPVLGIGAMLALVALVLGAAAPVIGSPNSSLAQVQTTPTLSPEAYCAQRIPIDPGLPPEKRIPFETYRRDCVAGVKDPIPQSERANYPRPRPSLGPAVSFTVTFPRRPAGAGYIEEDAPALTSLISTVNAWSEVKGNTTIRVYVGGRQADGTGPLPRPWKGVVWVEPHSADGQRIAGGGVYETATRVGSLRVVDARGERLVLSSETGATLYFDVPTRQFVPSLTGAAPTPAPTRRPYP